MYKTYDEFHPQGTSIPKHIAIIPDGGRRWARNHGVTYYTSYKKMCVNLSLFCRELFQKNIDIISLYFSSSQNFRRTDEEIESFCRAEAEFLNKDIKEFIQDYQINAHVVGKREGMPDYLITAIEEIPPICLPSEKKMYICINYNPHYEIEKAVLEAKEKGDLYVNYLDVKEPVDIMIRTGGAKVISNFLMPQIGFARLFFLDTLFNDLSVCDIKSILDDYARYELKYGN